MFFFQFTSVYISVFYQFLYVYNCFPSGSFSFPSHLFKRAIGPGALYPTYARPMFNSRWIIAATFPNMKLFREFFVFVERFVDFYTLFSGIIKIAFGANQTCFILFFWAIQRNICPIIFPHVEMHITATIRGTPQGEQNENFGRREHLGIRQL